MRSPPQLQDHNPCRRWASPPSDTLGHPVMSPSWVTHGSADTPFRRWIDASGDGRRQPPNRPPTANHQELVAGGAVSSGRSHGQNDGPHDRASDAVARIGIRVPSHFAAFLGPAPPPGNRQFRLLATISNSRGRPEAAIVSMPVIISPVTGNTTPVKSFLRPRRRT
jgi:hypothetical protein